MKWADTMKGNATVASLEQAATDGGAFHRAPAAPWSPFEVWLTRIKQPRERIANSAPSGRSNRIDDWRD